MEKPECFNISEPCSACNYCMYEQECDPTGEIKDKQLLEKNQHISNDEILQDIIDTEDEITQIERKICGHELINDKINFIIAEAYKHKLKERKDFIKSLNYLLELRKENKQ